MIRPHFHFVILLVLGSHVMVWADDEMDRVWALARQGKLEEAVGRAAAYVAAHPDDPLAYHGLGRMLFMKGDASKAVPHLKKCLSLKPRQDWATAWTHNVLGQAYAALDDREKAEFHLRKAVDLDATSNCTRDARRALAALTGEDTWGKGPLVGRQLPDFEFQGDAGETYGREDFQGRALLLKFGPSW